MAQRTSAVGYFCLLADDPASVASSTWQVPVGPDRTEDYWRYGAGMHHLLAKYLWDPHGEGACGTEGVADLPEGAHGRVVITQSAMTH